MNKPDRRIERTRRLLETALIELLQEHPFEQISVQDITDYANVGRTTFYLHYKDKDDVLDSVIRSMIEDTDALLPPLTLDAVTQGQVAIGVAAFRHVANNQKFYMAMLGKNGPAFIAARTRNRVAGIIAERLKLLAAPNGTRIPIDVMAQHMAGSMIAMMGWWLETGMTQSPEEMAAMYQQLNVPCIGEGLMSK